MTFLMQDGSFVLEGVKKVEVYKKGTPMYEDEAAEMDLVASVEDPVQIRVWFEEGMGGLDLVPAPVEGSAQGGSLAERKAGGNSDGG